MLGFFSLGAVLVGYVRCERHNPGALAVRWDFALLGGFNLVLCLLLRVGLEQAVDLASFSVWPGVFVYLLTCALVVLVFMRGMTRRIKTNTVGSLNDVCNAWTGARFARMKQEWTHVQITWLAFVQGTDHLLMFLYAHYILVASLWLNHNHNPSSVSSVSFHPTLSTRYAFACTGILAAVYDFLEGLFMHQALVADVVPERIPACLGVVSTMKWCYFMPGALFSLVQAVLHFML